MPLIFICSNCKKKIAIIDYLKSKGVFRLTLRSTEREYLHLEEAYDALLKLQKKCPYCGKELFKNKIKNMINV